MALAVPPYGQGLQAHAEDQLVQRLRVRVHSAGECAGTSHIAARTRAVPLLPQHVSHSQGRSRFAERIAALSRAAAHPPLGSPYGVRVARAAAALATQVTIEIEPTFDVISTASWYKDGVEAALSAIIDVVFVTELVIKAR